MKLKIGRADLAPLTTAIDALDTASTKEHSALELTAMFKRIENMMEGLRQRIKTEANTEFLELSKTNPKLSTWPFLQGIVQLSRYSPRSYWDYPISVIKLENELRDAQKQAQMSGIAKKKTPPVDKNSDTIFSVAVAEDYSREK
jgi:hypothetical protein